MDFATAFAARRALAFAATTATAATTVIATVVAGVMDDLHDSVWPGTRSDSRFRATQTPRIEVCPPEKWPSTLTLRSRLSQWHARLASTQGESAGVRQLTEARDDFLEALDDIELDAVAFYRQRIAAARHLRDLWHLRSAVYGLVARSHSQSEAERRTAGLNIHFPLRSAQPTRGGRALAALTGRAT